MVDPFFELVRGGEWNACVGEQADALQYVEGYLEAAAILSETVIGNKLLGSRDRLAMPILYNLRHGLELALKYALDELVELGLAAARAGKADHDIRAYWDHLDGQRVPDEALRVIFAEIRPFVLSLAQIDDDGQRFRYLESMDGKRGLAGKNVVNLELIGVSIEALKDVLHRLLDQIDRVSRERAGGIHTTRCSRTDLAEIAKIIGARETWSEPEFDVRKDDIRARYDLSSNDFCRALKAIEGAREHRLLIGLETPLVYLSGDKLLAVAKRWLAGNPPQGNTEVRIIDAGEVSFDEILTHMNESAAIDTDVLAMTDSQEFAEVQALYYTGRDGRFGESYDQYIAEILAEHVALGDRRGAVHHIMSKTNFLDALILGLRRVGQVGLADQFDALRA